MQIDGIIQALREDLVRVAALGDDSHEHRDRQRQSAGSGIASAFYQALETIARRRGLTRLYVEASEAARPLFARKGFTMLMRRDFFIREVSIHHYHMEKAL